MEQFRRGLPRRTPFVTVPNFDSDLHDVAGLTRMHRFLFTGAATASAAHARARASTTDQRLPTVRRRRGTKDRHSP